MTREESIKELTELLPEEFLMEYSEAIRMAIKALEQEPCEDVVSRSAVLKAIDVKAWEFCDYLIRNGRNDEQKPVSHFADNLRECVGDLPPVTPQPKMGYISIDDVMAVFDDFMRGDVDEDNTETFLEMLKDKAEGSEE